MVAKIDRITAAREIEKSLWDFLHHRNSDAVGIFETDKVDVEVMPTTHLHAIVCAHAFQGMSMAKRQELVWDHLLKHVSPASLAHLYAVHTWDPDEYRVYFQVADEAQTEH